VLICCALLLASLSELKREAQALMRVDPKSDRAGEILQEAARQGPEDAEAQYLLGRWALVKGRFQLAIQAETEAARLSPHNRQAQMQAWTIVAVANDQMNANSDADIAFQRAWVLNRSLAKFDPNAAYEYIKVLQRDHREDDAAPLVAEILRLSPDYGPAHLSKAKAFFDRREDTAACREAELALAQLTDYPEVERDAHYLLARIYLRLKRPDLAAVHTQWMHDHQ
jgi:tetratricopeptide (TPR) repeat protein